MALQTDGRILLGGSTSKVGASSDDNFGLARFNTDGTLDTDFGTSGIVTTDFGSDDDVAESMLVQPDDKIVLAGSTNGTTKGFALARYHRDGEPDYRFGDLDDEGTVIDNLSNPFTASGLALQHDGRLAAAGYYDNSGTFSSAVTRYYTGLPVMSVTTVAKHAPVIADARFTIPTDAEDSHPWAR